jgi:elongation factor 1-gamma
MSTLHGKADNFRTQKCQIVAKYCNKSITISDQPGMVLHKFGLQPTFDAGKTHLMGAEAIMMHLAENHMKGHNVYEHSETIQWLMAAESRFLPAILGWVLPSVSAMPMDKKAFETSKAELIHLLTALDEFLLTRTFLVGERISLADITMALNLVLAYKNVLEPSVRDQLGNVNRWFKTIINQPNVKSVIGEVTFCDKASVFDANLYKQNAELIHEAGGQHHKQHGHQKGKGKDKQPKEQKQEKKPKEKKEEEPEEEMDATEQALAAEPKSKDPFAALPKGTFNMDEFKRTYSNEDTIEKAIPYFWEHFDKENYSIWYTEYKYPQELSLVFMSCNLISGMFQRLEKLKKNAFASVCLFGENNNSSISGIWIWRGHQLAFELSEDWQIDYESYDWKMLDPDDEETKKMVNAYLAWDGFNNEKKFNQGKIFK